MASSSLINSWPLGPLRTIGAGGPDPAGIACAAAPGAVTGPRALHARMIPDQDTVQPQWVSLRALCWARLDQVEPIDAIVPRRQAEPSRREHDPFEHTFYSLRRRGCRSAERAGPDDPDTRPGMQADWRERRHPEPFTRITAGLRVARAPEASAPLRPPTRRERCPAVVGSTEGATGRTRNKSTRGQRRRSRS